MGAPEASMAMKQIQSILQTIEQKREDVAKSKAGMLQLQIGLDRAELALKNARVQLVRELQKFDPDMTTTFTKEELEFERVNA